MSDPLASDPRVVETAVQNNYALIITGNDDVLRRALAAGFEVVGDWPGQQPSGLGGPPPTNFIALRKHVPTPLAGVADYYRGERAPEGWFA